MKLPLSAALVFALLLHAVAADANAPRRPRAAPAALAKPALQDGQKLLSGTFTWASKPDEVHEIYVVLTPDGDKRWTARYLFQWGGRDTEYTGAIRGDLQSGEVEGTGDPAGAKRTFIFEGRATGSGISFNSFETTGGKKARQGTGKFKLEA